MKVFRTTLVLILWLLLQWTSGNKDISSKDSDSENLVHVAQGPIQGKVLQAQNGRSFHAFLGIPFGKATERFKEAEPAGPWQGVLDATDDAPSCLQYEAYFSKKINGVEDCLTLNVYTPLLPNNKTNTKSLPVMIFIYGGGFMTGTADSQLYGPERFMNNDIVLVIIQYRVGPFGFLSTHDAASQGNYGLLDQVLGMKWTKDNIHIFGGDSNKITIFGESAGGASVIFQVLSPLSKGLFQNAIAQSGSALCPWAVQKKPLDAAKIIASALGCPINNTQALVDCLRKADALEILEATNSTGMYQDLKIATVPVVENQNGGKFLTESPWTLFKEGRFNKVPMIIGVTQHEGAIISTLGGVSDHLNKNEKEFRELALPKLITWFTGIKNDSVMEQEVENKYFWGMNFTSKTDVLTRFVDLVSDTWFKSCSDSTARFIASQDVPVYMYVFDYVTEQHSLSNITGKADVTHGQELLYQFMSDEYVFNFTESFTDEENKFSTNFIDMWTNFATTSEPSSNASEIRWTKTPADHIHYLRITTNSTMETGFLEEKLQFWKSKFENQL